MANIKQLCPVSGKEFVTSEREQHFCKMMEVPVPKICPEERLRRRLLERNTRSLYYRKCDLSNKRIISQFHEDAPFPVYDQALWWGDDWDAMDYGQDFDFGRPFFEQLLELKNKVPHMSVFICGGTLENSDFTTCTGYLKNCYLICEADYDEDCYYSNRIYHSKNLVDCSNCYECELCYECIDVLNSHRLYFSQECESCSDSYFLRSCIGCRDCIGCVNQRHKQFMIFNKQYSEEDYKKKKREFGLSEHSGLADLAERCREIFEKAIYMNLRMERCENCLGDHLYDSKNSFACFDSKNLEDCMHCVNVAGGVKSCMDYTAWGFKAERVYASASCGDDVYNVKFCSNCLMNLSDAEYCYGCMGSKNIFGCVGLKKKQYCILNKQYSQNKFFELRARIIEHMRSTGEWGEFFPTELCSFAYNETIAMDHLPLEREEALKLGYRWREVPETNSGLDLLKCEVSGKAYRIINEERKFYKEMKLPLPLRCPDQRHKDRMAKRNPWKLYKRKCAKSGENILSSFSSKRPEMVVSKNVYLKELY